MTSEEQKKPKRNGKISLYPLSFDERWVRSSSANIGRLAADGDGVERG